MTKMGLVTALCAIACNEYAREHRGCHRVYIHLSGQAPADLRDSQEVATTIFSRIHVQLN